MRHASLFLSLIAVAVIAVCAGDASAAPMNKDLAVGGAGVPSSGNIDLMPTMWELFQDAPLTAAEIGSPAELASMAFPGNFAEPGAGNPNNQILGHIVPMGKDPVTGTSVYGIYDRLAVLPTPQLLYFDSYSEQAIPEVQLAQGGLTEALIVQESGSLSGAPSSSSASSGTSVLNGEEPGISFPPIGGDSGARDDPIDVTPIPLPPAAWAGLTILAGLGLTRLARRQRHAA